MSEFQKLTKEDKCDRCTAYALVRYNKTDKLLDFCDQHSKEFHQSLSSNGWKIVEDIREKETPRKFFGRGFLAGR